MAANWRLPRSKKGVSVPELSPVPRRELVRKLKALGFDGPYPGGKHQWMRKGTIRIIVPNPHAGDIDPGLIRRILRQAGIAVEDWHKT
jgi:predicted RNA binding protein YcfA (HicA-like mRNA interferase family)